MYGDFTVKGDSIVLLEERSDDRCEAPSENGRDTSDVLEASVDCGSEAFKTGASLCEVLVLIPAVSSAGLKDVGISVSDAETFSLLELIASPEG